VNLKRNRNEIEQIDTNTKTKELLPESIRKFFIFFILGLIFLSLIYFFVSKSSTFFFKRMYNYIVYQVVNVSGLSIWLVRGVVLLLMIPLYWALMEVSNLNIFLFKRRRAKKKLAKILILIYTGVFFLAMFFFSKDTYFGHTTGEVLKWYADTPEGIKFYDTPGVDPVYGIKLKPVTPEVIEMYKKRQLGLVPKRIYPQASNFEFFDPISGQPKVWYFLNSDGVYECFDRPGYHPVYKEPLKPITPEIVGKLKEQEIRLEEEKRSKEIAVKRQKEIENQQKEKNRFLSFVNKDIQVSPNKINIGLTINISGSNIYISPETIFSNYLKQPKLNLIPDYFKSNFKNTEYFKQILGGNTGILEQTDALSKIDYLIIGNISFSLKKTPEIEQDLISCKVVLNYKLINKKGEIVKSNSLNATGSGFSEEDALKRGIELLIENHIEQILSGIT